MPVYEYYCSDCRAKFDVLTSFEESQEPRICATCHGSHVRKVLSVFARSSSRGGSDEGFADGGESGDGWDDAGGGCCGGACGCHN